MALITHFCRRLSNSMFTPSATIRYFSSFPTINDDSVMSRHVRLGYSETPNLTFLTTKSDNPEDLPATSEDLGFDFSETLNSTSCSDHQICKDAESISTILIQHYNPFHTLESSLQLNGIRLSHELVHQILIRLKNVSKIALGFFVWAKEHANHRHDITSYDLMIDILGKIRQFDVALQLLVEMDQQKLNPGSKTFLILIRRYIAAGLTRQAIRIFDDMEVFVERGIHQDDFILLLDTLCKYGYVKIATEIFNKRKLRFEPTTKAYTVLIYGWCKINNRKMAEKFFREMIDRGYEPNVVTYNILLNGICRKSSLHPENRLERTIRFAEQLFDEMIRKGIDPDVTSYSIVLHVYSRAHKPELTLLKFNAMKEKGINPTVATYTSVVKCLCSCGRMDDAHTVLEEMIINGVFPSPTTYNCFFKEYRGRKDITNAIKLYRMIKEKSPSSLQNLHTYNILISMFSKLNQVELVKDIWNDMIESGIGPDLDSYTLLIHGLCEKQKWREACRYFVEMIERGFLPQKITFETLYRGLIQSDMLRTWRRLKKRLDEESEKFGLEFQQYQFKPYRR